MESSEHRGTGKRFALLLVLFVVLPLAFVALYLVGNVYSIADVIEPYTLSIIAGAAAYVLFMGQFLLAARIGFLERVIPQDKLILIHAETGISLSFFVLVHFALKWFLAVRWAPPSIQSLAGFAVLAFYAVLAPLAAVVFSGNRRSDRKRKMTYGRAKALHNLFAAAGVLVAIHVLMAASTWSVALRVFAAGWAVICLGAYIRHKVFRPQKRREFALEERTEIASGIHRFRFSNETAASEPDRLPGQFGYWSFETGGTRPAEEKTAGKLDRGKPSVIDGAGGLPGTEEHPFTVSSPPGEPMEITVRSSGDFTEALPRVEPGTRVRFDGPYGGFSPAGLPEGTPLLLLAGGIGITPFLSMAGENGPFRTHPAYLLWSVRNSEEAALGAPLADLAKKGVLHMRTAYTRSAPSGAETGRIDEEMVREAAAFLTDASGPAGRDGIRAFVCGPADFSRDMRAFVRDFGIPRRNITEERFSWDLSLPKRR